MTVTETRMNVFELKSGKHCLLSCIQSILNYYQVYLSEGDLYFLCRGMEMKYEKESCYIGAPYDFILEKLSNTRMADMTCDFHVKQEAPVSRKLFNILNNSLPVILCMNSQYLKYHKEFYQSSNRKHFIILNGYDAEREMISIADPLMIDEGGAISKYCGENPIDSIVEGIWGYIAIHGVNPDRISFDMRKLVMQNIESIIDHDSGGNCGMQTLKRYFEDMLELSSVEDKVFQESCSIMYYYLKLGSVMHVLLYLKNFLVNHFDEEREGINQIKKSIMVEMEEWKKFCFSLMKMGIQHNRSKLPVIYQNAMKRLASIEHILKKAKLLIL